MRPTIIGTAALFLGIATVVSGAPEEPPKFPYAAEVHVASAAVRSGPGEEFFTTQQLKAGSRIEVYGHVDGQWAAIRPPPGSYSLVPVDAVHLTDQPGIGVIVMPDISTRVGAPLAAPQRVEYVPLQVGEPIEILGTEVEETGDVEHWYRIKPPAGEFRWMALADVVLQPQETVTAPHRQESDRESFASPQETQPPPEVSVAPRLAATTDIARPTSAPLENELSPGVSAGPGERLQAREASLAAYTDEADNASGSKTGRDDPPPERAANAETPRGDQVTQTPAEHDASVPLSEVVLPPLVAEPLHDAISSRPTDVAMSSAAALQVLQRELAEIDLRLSLLACDDPDAWQLEDLRLRLRVVIDAGNEATVREQAQLLLAKIARFEDLRRRHHDLHHTALAPPPAPSLPRPQGPGNLLNVTPPRQAVAAQTNGPQPYDGSGWLMPVLGGTTGVPRYALTDDAGNIVQFVSPSTGMNLRRYERRRVGVYGQRGYLPTVNRPHLTAERIISLDRVRR